MTLAFLFVFIFFIGWILAFLGFGITVNKLLLSNQKLPDYLMLAVFGILGMITVTIIATALNFFIPITLTVSIVILVTGLILLAAYGRQILAIVDKYDLALVSSLAIAIFTVIPMLWISWYDTGLYHLPAIKWIIESPVPLGLANLHSRFGFNSSWFVLSGLTEQLVFIFNYPYFILNSIFALFFLSAPVLLIKRIFTQKLHNIRFSDIFLLMSVIPTLLCGIWSLSSTSPDFPITVLTLFIMYLIILYLESSLCGTQILLVMAVISAYAVTIKLSAVPLIFFTLFMLVLSLFLHRKNINGIFHNPDINLINVCAFIFILLLVWALRGIAISGCITYPSLIGYIPWLSWSIPRSMAIIDTEWVTGWARSPDAGALQSLNNWNWLLPWLFRNIKLLGFAFMFAVLGIAIIVFTIIKKQFPLDKMDYIKVLVPSVLSLSGLIFWFLQAPDPRFGYGYIFSLPLIILCWGLSLYLEKREYAVKGMLLIATVISLFICLIFIYIIINHYPMMGMALGGEGYHIPEVSINVSKTYDGMTIYVPTSGDQVWNAPLPNTQTPDFNKQLHMKISNSTGLPYVFWYDNKN